jgi:hypothetical protein
MTTNPSTDIQTTIENLLDGPETPVAITLARTLERVIGYMDDDLGVYVQNFEWDNPRVKVYEGEMGTPRSIRLDDILSVVAYA